MPVPDIARQYVGTGHGIASTGHGIASARGLTSYLSSTLTTKPMGLRCRTSSSTAWRRADAARVSGMRMMMVVWGLSAWSNDDDGGVWCVVCGVWCVVCGAESRGSDAACQCRTQDESA
eukprot:138841-Rhodomonas_salina.1